MSKTPRSSIFKNPIKLAYSYRCALSNFDELQCEAAHIIPVGENDTEPNGMLLSVDLHRLYDRYVWCPNPDTRRTSPFKKGFYKYDIEISDKYSNKELSINKYKYTAIEIKEWSHPFVIKAYEEFRKKNYPETFKTEEIIEEKVKCEYCNVMWTKRGLKKHQNTCSKNERRSN